MKKEDGKLRLNYCKNSSCELYQKDITKAKVLYCPYCGTKLSSNER